MYSGPLSTRILLGIPRHAMSLSNSRITPLTIDTGVERQVQALSIEVVDHVKAAELHSVA